MFGTFNYPTQLICMRSFDFVYQRFLLIGFNIILLCFIVLTSCKKDVSVSSNERINNLTPVPVVTSEFGKYTILKSNHYCDSSRFIPTEISEMKFLVKFDSSAIYTSVLPENQYDINKLYGFSDNGGDHHAFSARFGWRWSDKALRLFGYIYNNNFVQYKELGVISIASENKCSIKVTDSTYIFSLNSITTSMPRKSTTAKAVGYKLFPYFGGDEIAPHDVFIYIKDL